VVEELAEELEEEHEGVREIGQEVVDEEEAAMEPNGENLNILPRSRNSDWVG